MNRLLKIFSLIDKCGVFADIGCDHGKLCKMVADKDLAERVIAADISAASLSKARELLKGYENAEFYVSDGFNQIPVSVDCAAISGMGGREILKIISAHRVKTLILQPQNQIDAVRRNLYETGYEIIKDEIVKENDKFYFVLKAVLSETDSEDNSENETDSEDNCEYDKNRCKRIMPSAVQEMYGMFYAQKSGLLKELLERDEKKYSCFKATKENEDKLKIIRETLLCQQ